MKKVNWGIIGLGSIALKFASGFRDVKNANLKGISSKNLNKLNDFKKKFKIKENFCFLDYEKLIDCEDIDIIYIALPHSYHYEWIIKSIKKEKKILVEKPATINFTQIKEIKNYLAGKNIFFAEGFMYRYHPQILKIIDLINTSTIGNLLSMESYFGMNILEKKNFLGIKKTKKINESNRLFNKDLGGGVILDLGCYPVSFSVLIASLLSKSNNNEVKVQNKKIEFIETGVDVDSYAELIFGKNFVSYIGASFKKDLGKKTKIIGDKGEILIEDTWHGNPGIINVTGKNNYSIKIDSKDNIFSYEIETLSNCILENKKEPKYPGMTISDTYKNMKILDEWLN